MIFHIKLILQWASSQNHLFTKQAIIGWLECVNIMKKVVGYW